MSVKVVPSEIIEKQIFMIRGQKVMVDKTLAGLYGVETKVLVQAVNRNKVRFPSDFMFQLTKVEFINLRSQFGFGLINSVEKNDNNGTFSV